MRPSRRAKDKISSRRGIQISRGRGVGSFSSRWECRIAWLAIGASSPRNHRTAGRCRLKLLTVTACHLLTTQAYIPATHCMHGTSAEL